MRATTKFILLLSLIICSQSACKKDALTDTYAELIGTWSSIASAGDIGNCGINIGTAEDPNLKLIMQKNGRFQLFKDDEKIEAGRLLIIDSLVTFRDSEKKSSFDRRTLLKFNADTLKIDRTVCDNDFAFIFVKMK